MESEWRLGIWRAGLHAYGRLGGPVLGYANRWAYVQRFAPFNMWDVTLKTDGSHTYNELALPIQPNQNPWDVLHYWIGFD